MIKYASIYTYGIIELDRHSLETSKKFHRITNRTQLWNFGRCISNALQNGMSDVIVCVMHRDHPIVYDQVRLPDVENQSANSFLKWMCTFVRPPKDETCATCGMPIPICRKELPVRATSRVVEEYQIMDAVKDHERVDLTDWAEHS